MTKLESADGKIVLGYLGGQNVVTSVPLEQGVDSRVTKREKRVEAETEDISLAILWCWV